MFLALFSGHFIQDVSHGFPCLAHNCIWLRGLGTLFTRGILGLNRDSVDPSPSTHHQMEPNILQSLEPNPFVLRLFSSFHFAPHSKFH
jgi:hypothetical protein